MDKKTVRAGIIGSGFAARFHYDALQRVFSTKVEIVGVYSVSAAELQEYTETRNLTAFHNLEELIAQSDILHVCTPPVTHEPIVIAALKQNKHVIVEKPFTGYFGDGSDDFNGDTFSREEGLNQTLLSIQRMLEAEKQSEGVIMYAENWVYAPPSRKSGKCWKKPAPRSSGCTAKNPIRVLIRWFTASGSSPAAGL
jgi:hypothetical protein